MHVRLLAGPHASLTGSPPPRALPGRLGDRTGGTTEEGLVRLAGHLFHYGRAEYTLDPWRPPASRAAGSVAAIPLYRCDASNQAANARSGGNDSTSALELWRGRYGVKFVPPDGALVPSDGSRILR